MRLLHVISSMDPELGGVCQAVRTIINGLEVRGICSEVVSLDDPDAYWSQIDSFTINALGPARGPWHYSEKLIPWLLDNFIRFDTVLLHGLWLYNGYALNRALHLFKLQQRVKKTDSIPVPKFFVMPHGMLDPYFQHAAGRKLKAWRNQIYWHLIENKVIRNADGLLFTCETEQLLARQPFAPYRPKREAIVGLGVKEPPPYTPAMRDAFLARCPTLENRPYILFLSRIHEKKGVDLLVQAYIKLIQNVSSTIQRDPEVPAGDACKFSEILLPALVIAGPGLDTPYGQQIQHLAAQLSGSIIHFPGMLVGEAKWGAFYGCEAFVLPSHQENFGIAVVEALACNKAVLISNQVNIWREIHNVGGGLVNDNTFLGTQYLLEEWCKLSTVEKLVIGERAQIAYQNHFAVTLATEKMAAALQ